MTWASVEPGLALGEPDRNLRRVHPSFIRDPHEREDIYRDITMHLSNSVCLLLLSSLMNIVTDILL
jgi:hypothetical protein